MGDKKAPNYTDAQTVELIEAYNGAGTDEERGKVVQHYSEELNKSAASIRMKLVAEKVYIKPAYVSKAGKKSETKSVIVSSIAKIVGVTEEQLQGLDKATVKALNTIRDAFKDASEEIAILQNETGELGQPGDRPAAE